MTSSGPPKDATSPGTLPVNAIPRAGLIERCYWVLRKRLRFRISGSSMQPYLEPGEYVLVKPCVSARPGEVVVARHPYRTDVILVKAVASIDEAGNMFLIGTNPEESTDSRTQGGVPMEKLLGTVISKM